MRDKGRVVVAGGSGFVGSELLHRLSIEGYRPVVLSRGKPAVSGAVEVVGWDALTLGPWAEALEGAAAVVNLTGHPVAVSWTPENRRLILDSRVKSTRVLGEAIAAAKEPPPVWINGSAVGFYGDTGSREVSEASPAGKGFLAEVCQAWEKAQAAAHVPATRKVTVRIGFVVGSGGALEKIVPLAKAFLGGSIGSGKQYMPWIDVRDLARLMVWAIENPVEGPLNGTAPVPVTNSEFMGALRHALGRPWSPPAPEFALRLMERVGGPPADMVLTGQRAVPALAIARGFQFDHRELAASLAHFLDDTPAGWKR